jgi:hypothetical protein
MVGFRVSSWVNTLVNYFYILFFIFTFALDAISVNLPAKMTVKIAPTQIKEPIVMEVSIIRLAWQKVDPATFQIGDASYPAKLLEEHVAIPGSDQESTMVSTYRITLPAKPAGLYVLPRVSAMIGNVRIYAPQISYEVIVPQKSQDLLLEAQVVEKSPYYPGEKLTLQYRILFNKPIALTKEVLPLLTMQGFDNVGTPVISNIQEKDYTVQVISQSARAKETGTFHSGVSTLEGYIYQEGALGERVYVSPLLVAEAPDVVIQIDPFPQEGRPISFTGALGDFYWRVKLKSPATVAAGEKIDLEVQASGQGLIDTCTMPDLSLQPGFSQSFRIQNLDPQGQEQDGTKLFTFSLLPLTSYVKEIPSMEFSSFDPISKRYIVRRSDPIQVKVLPRTSQPQGESVPQAPKLQENVMVEQSQSETFHMDYLLLLYAFFVIAAIACVIVLIRSIIKGGQDKNWNSRQLMLEAIKTKSNPEASCKKIKEALLMKLFEANHIKHPISSPQELSSDGLQGEIRSFLLSIDEKRFSGLKVQTEIQILLDVASSLYNRIQRA